MLCTRAVTENIGRKEKTRFGQAKLPLPRESFTVRHDMTGLCLFISILRFFGSRASPVEQALLYTSMLTIRRMPDALEPHVRETLIVSTFPAFWERSFCIFRCPRPSMVIEYSRPPV